MNRECGLTDTQRERMRAFVARSMGLAIPPTRLLDLDLAVCRRSDALRLSNAGAYLDRLDDARTAAAESRALAAHLTVGETYFFRHPEQLQVLASAVRRRLARPSGQARAHRSISILSAGCASGEEPYTVAMLLRSCLDDDAMARVSIGAVDANPEAIERARSGVYTEWSLRDTPPDQRARYFTQCPGGWRLADSIRSMVTLGVENLVEDGAGAGREPGAPAGLATLESLDLVLCRNVLMYLTPDAAATLVARIARALVQGGTLYLSPAETLRGLTQQFALRHTGGAFYYQKRAQGAPCPPSAPAWPDLACDSGKRTPPTSAPAPYASGVPATCDTNGAWVEAIDRASRRVATLSESMGPDGAGRGGPLGVSGGSAYVEAMALLGQERLDEALAVVSDAPGRRRAHQAPGGDAPSRPHGDGDSLLLEAVLLTNRGRIQDAQRICRRLLLSNDLDAGAHYLMALCREAAGDSRGAVEHDVLAVAIDATFAMPHVHLGLLAQRRNDSEAASRHLRSAIPLLTREDASRILLFGGGFSRDALIRMCSSGIHAREDRR